MKMFSVLLISTLASAAFAWPTVGDLAVYDLTLQQAGVAQPKIGTAQLQVTAVDASKDQLTLVETTDLGTQHDVQTLPQTLSNWNGMAQAVPTVVAKCAQFRGTVESVVTSTGVTIPACKVAMDNAQSNVTGFTWFGDVVFGMVKQMTVQNGQTETWVLRSATPAAVK
jgi:hypothetical protein